MGIELAQLAERWPYLVALQVVDAMAVVGDIASWQVQLRPLGRSSRGNGGENDRDEYYSKNVAVPHVGYPSWKVFYSSV